jgi:putative pyruvate formate lyase activating enzyme
MKPSAAYLPEQEWDRIIASLDKLASPCQLCPRACRVDRLKGETGFCGAPGELIISSIFLHHGEEPPISGTGGSGTVFFSHCTLKCIFCQNFQISQGSEGRPYSVEELAAAMVDLQTQGCHNINLVTATHFLPWVVRAIRVAVQNDLSIPIVYNCSGYEQAHVMALLKGIVDIYLPDMKYGDNAHAKRYSQAADYVDFNKYALREMFRQVGPLKTDENGIAVRGLCIRHLVLPEGGAGSFAIVDYLEKNYDPQDLTISLMAQYRPLYKACEYREINRQITLEEYEPVKEKFISAGFNGFFQELERMDTGFVIDFSKRKRERLTGE